jgi:hypothetical protein
MVHLMSVMFVATDISSNEVRVVVLINVVISILPPVWFIV